MPVTAVIKQYPPREEKINILSHFAGIILSLPAALFLLIRAEQSGGLVHIISAALFGLTLILMYTISTVYHNAKLPAFRIRMRIMDHAAIYLLIAGTYTPFTLISLKGIWGGTLFALCWIMALAGVGLKIFFTGKYGLLSTLLYIFMGWMIIVALKPLSENLAAAGLFWLIAGGIAYTVGEILYSIKKIPFNHAIFHLFVLLGSTCHWISVYFYVLSGGSS